MSGKQLIRWAALHGTTAVVVLALAAHALENKLQADQLRSVQTAGSIQLFHAILFVALAALDNSTIRVQKLTGPMLVLGTCLFSFSIYLLILKHLDDFSFLRYFWPVTPLGGILLIAGWVSLFFSKSTNHD